jgi:hypothetical protein
VGDITVALGTLPPLARSQTSVRTLTQFHILDANANILNCCCPHFVLQSHLPKDVKPKKE